MSQALIEDICRKHHYDFYDHAANEPVPEFAVERSFCTPYRSKKYKPEAGWGYRPRIMLGAYKDQELRLISFFHEVGHIMDVENKLLPDSPPYKHFSEASAWRRGLRIAHRHGIVFSDKAMAYAKTALSTYFGDDDSRKAPSRFLSRAIDYAFNDARLIYEK